MPNLASQQRVAAETLLSVEQVHLRYGSDPDRNEVISDLSIEVREGEFVCLVGPSGCGKTTLLRLMAGLLRPTAGHVALRGEQLHGPTRDIAVVFQDYSRSLCPWRNAVKNVELPLEVRGVKRTERRQRALEALDTVKLREAAFAHPRMLSGGMQQRIQLARAIAMKPRVLLMDEPFASLDALTKFHLEDMLLDTWRKLEQTVVLVTHDLDEAVYLADRVFVLTAGPATVSRIVEIDLPRPRHQVETRALEEFATLRTSILQLIDSNMSS